MALARSGGIGRAHTLFSRRARLVSGLALAALAAPGLARGEEPLPAETPAETAPSPTPAEVEAIWTADGCAGILAQVKDAVTGNPLPGARISIVPRGQEAEVPSGVPDGALRSPVLRRLGRTTAEGTFIVQPPGAAHLVVTLPGYAPADAPTPCSDAITVLEVNLVPLSPAQSEEASAGGDAHRTLGGEALATMAGAPRNVFQAIQTVPGVARPTFGGDLMGSILGSGDLGVRGSRPGESRSFLDGIEIPYFYHYLAFSSVIPAEMIDFVDFVPGGAGPQFGRLTGGVLDIHSYAARATDNDEPWHGRANMTFFEANAIARGPMGDKNTLSISDRWSVWDLVYKANPNGWGNGAPVWGYNDFQVVFKRVPSPGVELDALTFGSFDDLAFISNPTLLHTEFYRSGLTFKKETERTRWSLAASYGYDRFLMRLLEPGQGIRMSSERRNQDLRVEGNGSMVVKDIPLRAGLELHAVRPEASLKLDWEQQEWAIIDRTFWDRGAWGGAWTEAEIRPLANVVLIPGVRFDYDTLVGKGWVDPRATARWFVNDLTMLSASGGLYHRPDPFALAFVDGKFLGLTQGSQFSLGVNRKLGPGLDVDVRLYRNDFRHEVQGVEWLPDFNREAIGNAWSMGGELFAKLATSNARTSGTLGVTASRTNWYNKSTETDPGNAHTEHWTASDLDSTYAVTAVMNHLMRHDWVFGLRSRWYTGLPYTAYEANVYVPDDGGSIAVGRQPWAKRAPSFFQTDIRFTKHWELGSRMGMEFFFDVQNVTGRHNVDRLNANYDANTQAPSAPTASTAMPLFPSLGVSVTF